MELAFLVYLIDSLDNLSQWLTIGTIVCVLSILIGFFPITEFASPGTAGKLVKRATILAVVFSIIQVFIPSTKTAYTMVAAYAVQSAYTNPKVEQMSSKVLKLIDQKLEEYIAEGEQEIVQRAAKTSSAASKSR